MERQHGRLPKQTARRKEGLSRRPDAPTEMPCSASAGRGSGRRRMRSGGREGGAFLFERRDARLTKTTGWVTPGGLKVEKEASCQ